MQILGETRVTVNKKQKEKRRLASIRWKSYLALIEINKNKQCNAIHHIGPDICKCFSVLQSPFISQLYPDKEVEQSTRLRTI